MKGEVTGKENAIKVGKEVGAMSHNIGDNMDNPLNNETQKSNSGEKTYICPYCSAKLDQSIDYARHIRLKH